MIGMLRRRLMSNMAKAKNIATGTVAESYNKSLTINGLDFQPNHVVLHFMANTDGKYTIISLYDNHAVAMEGTDIAKYTCSLTFKNDGVVCSLSDDSYSDFSGTYRYVAWQE